MGVAERRRGCSGSYEDWFRAAPRKIFLIPRTAQLKLSGYSCRVAASAAPIASVPDRTQGDLPQPQDRAAKAERLLL
ncbi:hypothetical protein J3R74_000889 [Puniceicoccus vermicola]